MKKNYYRDCKSEYIEKIIYESFEKNRSIFIIVESCDINYFDCFKYDMIDCPLHIIMLDNLEKITRFIKIFENGDFKNLSLFITKSNFNEYADILDRAYNNHYLNLNYIRSNPNVYVHYFSENFFETEKIYIRDSVN